MHVFRQGAYEESRNGFPSENDVDDNTVNESTHVILSIPSIQ